MDRRRLFSQRLRDAPVRLSKMLTTFAAARPAVSATELSRPSGLPTATPFLAAALRAALAAPAGRAAAGGRALAPALLRAALRCAFTRAALRRAFRAGPGAAACARPRCALGSAGSAARLLSAALGSAL